MRSSCQWRPSVSAMHATNRRHVNTVPRAYSLVQAGLIIAYITGCAANDDQKSAYDESPEYTAGSACFYASQASDWTVLDRSTLIVYAPSKSHAFRVDVGPGASDLRWADSLAFVSRSSRICGRAGDRIVTPTGTANRSYTVIGVTRLDPASVEDLLAAYGKAGQSEQVEPGESPGAEIERELDTIEADSEDGQQSEN